MNYYSTRDIAALCGKSKEAVAYTNGKYLHIVPIEVSKTREFLFTKEQADVFVKYFNRVKTPVVRAKTPTPEQLRELEEMKLKHPLVKDERFLRLSFFPTEEEIKPLCFKD